MGVRLGSLVTLYQWRLRKRLAQELLAAGGIVVGVALVFGVLLANTTVTGSAGRLVHQLVGSARLQLAARSAEGFDQHLAEAAGRLPGVQVATPLLRENATIVGPGGRQSIQIVGVTPRLVALGSAATQNLGSGALLIAGGVGLPTAVAHEIGARMSRPVTLVANGEVNSLKVRAVLGSQTIGSVAASPVAIALLPIAQRLAGRPGRVTNVLIKPRPGADALVARELRALARGRIDVTPADNELRLLSQAAQPNAQSTTLFAVISAMIGFLLALNAMLLTVPDRRRFIAELRTQGFAPRQVVLVLGFQALTLGVVASILGILFGEVLSHTLFGQIPNYLTFAFPISSQRVVSAATILIPAACGVLAALLASLPPLLDLRSNKALDAVLHESGEAGQSITRRTMLVLGAIGCALVLAVTIGALAVPRLTALGGALLALAAVCLIPCAFEVVTSLLTPVGESVRGSMLSLAIVELRASTTRSIALAAVAGLAVYGSVAVGGARDDLLGGIDEAIVQYFHTADVWVVNGEDIFNMSGIGGAGTARSIARAPGVASVRVYQGGVLDVGTRRLWLRARPAEDPAPIEVSQVVHGNATTATRLIRGGGWAAISTGFAEEHDLRVGQSFQLPTPSGSARFGVAAIMTNSGWPPGAITIDTSDYRRYWSPANAAALEVSLRAGVDAQAGSRAVRAALGAHSGLAVRTSGERTSETEASARQGLQSLRQISLLLLIAGALAIAASLSAVIWQRRARLASMKTQGFDQWQLWRSLILESVIVLIIGCLDGAVLGVYGHALADRWLRLSTGFPAPFSAGLPQVFLTFVIVAGIALAVVALPGWSAVQGRSNTRLQE
ncbi:MAG: FtsX-like permease family protein [Solirubrobacterales bacterium]